jgi:hypothetical protein
MGAGIYCLNNVLGDLERQVVNLACPKGLSYKVSAPANGGNPPVGGSTTEPFRSPAHTCLLIFLESWLISTKCDGDEQSG